MMNIPVLGLVENMSYVVCPDCGKEIRIFGNGKIDEIAQRYGFDILGRLPMDASLAALCDSGRIEEMDNKFLSDAFKTIDTKLNK